MLKLVVYIVTTMDDSSSSQTVVRRCRHGVREAVFLSFITRLQNPHCTWRHSYRCPWLRKIFVDKENVRQASRQAGRCSQTDISPDCFRIPSDNEQRFCEILNSDDTELEASDEADSCRCVLSISTAPRLTVLTANKPHA